MQITFVSNFLNHHQVNVADIIYSNPEIDYHFIATMPIPEVIKNSGYEDFSNRPYLICTYENEEQMQLGRSLIDSSDVVVIGSAPEEWVRKRLLENKVTFHYSERWFKRGVWQLFDPRQIISRFKYHVRFRNKRSYMLCASAFAASDCRKVFAYPKKCFKWGYFTQVPELNIEKILEAQNGMSKLKILYISRFLTWKHPEMPVLLARFLKDKDIDFELNMYGSGPEFGRISRLINDLNVLDCVNLCGNRPNNEILHIMRQHHIFLFTSDSNEGWGAVVNEAMSNGCAVVAGNKIGCVPFLIQDKVNGVIFKDQDLRDLVNKALYLIENPTKREEIVRNAYKTMTGLWTPRNAASSFVELAKSALIGNIVSESQGPCSMA